MNYRKIVILPSLFVLSTVIYLSCCPKSQVFEFYKITGIGASAYGSGRAVVDTGLVTNVDSIYLNYGFIQGCAKNSTNPASFLMNQSFALSCLGNICGEQGIKNKIQSIKISSDSIYNSLPANTSLNNYFKINLSNTIFIGVDSLVTLVNDNKKQLQWEQFVITTKPSNNRGHVFKLDLQFLDGTILTASTKRIFWN